MKKIYLMLFAIIAFYTGNFAQTVPLYHFTASSGSYSPITAGGGATTVFTSSDSIINKTATALPIGFTFNYNGSAFTTFGICSDGWISMGSAAPFFAFPGNTTPVNESGTSNNIICGFGYKLMGVQNLSVMSTVGSNILTTVNWDATKIVDGDHIMAVTGKIPGGVTIVSHTATTITMSAPALATYTTAGGYLISVAGQGTNNIQYQTIGTAPNRKLVVQYTNFSRWIALGSTGTFFSTSTVGGNITFQIILNETTDAINTVYNTLPISTVTNSASDAVQVGLKGASNTEFNIRSTTTNWNATTDATTNSASCSYSSSVSPAIGQTFTWTPPVACNSVVGGTTTATSTSICSGLTTTLKCVGATSDVGISYQWQVATTPGGPYNNVTGGTVSGTQSSSSYTTAALTSPNTVNTHYYYVLKTTCSNGGANNLSNEIDITVKGLPNVTVTPSTGTVCSNGTGIGLVASGASSYTWTSFSATAATTNTLSSTNTATTTATPAINSTYTVTGTDAQGCTNTAVAKINVAQLPANTVSATPTSVCTGTATSLTSTAVLGANQDPYPTDLAFTGSTGTFTSIVGVTGTNLLSAVSGNMVGATGFYLDGQTTTDPLFTFKYNRTTYSKIAVNTNGVMKFWTSGTFNATAANSLWNLNSTYNLLLAPFWDDNNYIGAVVNSGVYILMTGTAPNRVCTIEWNNMSVGAGVATTASTPTISVQVKLYEGTNVIQYIYGPTSAPLINATATIGLNGTSGSSVGNFTSVTPASSPAASTISNIVENSTIANATNIPSGTTYTFTPPTWPLTYLWSPASDVVNSTALTTNSIPLTATDVFNMAATFRGCTISATTPATVTITPSVTPTATLTGSATGCTGVVTTFTVNGTNLGTAPVYSWTVNGTAVTNTGNTFSYTNATAGTYVIGCSVASNAACASPASVTTNTISYVVSTTVTPTITLTGNATGCTGVATTFTATGTNLGTAPVYNWTVDGNAVTNSGNTFTYTNATAGTYVIGCSVTSNATCASPAMVSSNTISLVISTTVTPTATLTGSTTGCTGAAKTFTVTGTNLGTAPVYSWTVNGTAVTNSGNTLSYMNATAGTYVIGCSVASNATCASPASVSTNTISYVVSTTVTPTATLTGNATGCTANATLFTVTGTNLGTTPVYNWTVNGTAVVNTGSTFSYTNATAGTYIIGCSVTSNATCASVASVSTNTISCVLSSPVTPTATLTGNATGCAGSATTFTVTGTNLGTAPIYNWTVNGTAVVNTGNTFSYNNATAGTYIIGCKVTSNATCVTTALATTNTISYVNNAVLTATATLAGSSTGCDAAAAAFTVSGNNLGSAPVYTWKVNGSSVTNIGNSFSYQNAPGTYLISCDVTSNAVCVAPATVTSNVISFVVNPYTAISLSSIPATVCKSDASFALSATPAGGNYSINGNAVTSNIISPTTLGVGTVNVTYTVTINGCTTTASKAIQINECSDRHLQLTQPGAILVLKNPNNGLFNLLIKSDIITKISIKTFNSLGQYIKSEEFSNLTYGSAIQMNLSNQAAGAYRLLVTNNEFGTTAKKVLNIFKF